MKKPIYLLLLAVLLSCNQSANKKQKEVTESKPKYKLELVWQSDTLLRTPESVLIDIDRNLLYVSNVNLNPWEKDGNGFISKMDRSGKITELKWIEGLSGPKGMGISGNSLFIADISELVEANIETGEIIRRIALEGNPQLNDITVGEDGKVYVSGTGSNTIYQVNGNNLEALFTGNEGERFNGLFSEKERMLLVTSGSSQFKEVNLTTKAVKIISENIGHGDCLAPVGDGGYITTSWKGAVFYVSSEGEKTTLLDTEALGENAADGAFCLDERILYLPTFFKNQVKAYRLVKE
jgi:outer membrane protein assembly factor BamB